MRFMRFMAALVALAPAAAAAQTVSINEVMYRPWNEDTFGRYEFVEVYNYGTEEVDLGGQFLTDSLDWVSICKDRQPEDNEGVFLIPEGTVVGPGEYLTFWHTAIPGVTDQPGNVVYDQLEYFTNLVLNDGGDQVAIFACQGNHAEVTDAFDWSTLELLQTPHNVSLERISPSAPTQDVGNWGFTTANPGGPLYGGGYTPGGTPGAINTIADY